MHAQSSLLIPAADAAASDNGPLFPWSLGEIRASLAVCPPAAFHVTGLRLERLGGDEWWGDLAGYRDDLGCPFTWQGFRIRRGKGWEVTLPPYLADLDGAWRALVFGTIQRLVTAALGDDATVKSSALFVTVERPSGMPGPGNAGGARVTPAERSVAQWLRLAKRFRFAARFTRNQTVLVVGGGPGARMLARLARRVIAVDPARETLEYTARAYRSPRLSFTTTDPGRLSFPAATFDSVIWLDAPADGGLPTVLAEAARVLRPDGTLVVGTADPGEFGRVTTALGPWFEHVDAWSQRPSHDRGDIAAEFEMELGAGADAEYFIAIARRRVAEVSEIDRLRQGAELLAAGRLTDAFPIFADILKSEPTSIGALIGAAHCALAVDDTRAARALLRRVLAVDPHHASVQAALAELDGAPGSGDGPPTPRTGLAAPAPTGAGA